MACAQNLAIGMLTPTFATEVKPLDTTGAETLTHVYLGQRGKGELTISVDDSVKINILKRLNLALSLQLKNAYQWLLMKRQMACLVRPKLSALNALCPGELNCWTMALGCNAKMGCSACRPFVSKDSIL